MRRICFVLSTLLAFGFLACTTAFSQENTLHIGLREDPDLLDPILGSSYVGRIVFAGLCDKLFEHYPGSQDCSPACNQL